MPFWTTYTVSKPIYKPTVDMVVIMKYLRLIAVLWWKAAATPGSI